MKKISKLTALALSSLMLLSACGAKQGSSTKKSDQKAEKQEGFKINPIIENEGTPVKDATLKVGMIGESAFKGIFNEAYAQNGDDMEIMAWGGMAGFFDSDPDFKTAKTGAGHIEFKPEEKKAFIKIHDNVKWSDGVPVTAKDFLRYYLIIGHPDYTGIRYGTDYTNVVGMEEYKAGKADNVSGVKVIDDKTLEINFKQFDHSIYWSKGIPFNPVPDHVFKDIPVKDQEASDAVRKNPLSWGAYVIKEIIPGQQVIIEANPYSYLGEPKTKKIEFKIVPSAQVVAACQSGEYDIITGFGSDLYPKFAELKNGKIATQYSGGYGYVSFKLGKYNKEKGEVVTDPNAKMADKALRQAIAKAIDRDSINSKLLNGLSIPLYQIIPPYFATLYDKDYQGLRFNLEEAKKILDDAGYKDTNNDGIREDKKGQPLKINFAAMQGGATQEPMVQFMMQKWKEIGLDVQLTNGRLTEFKDFYDKLQSDDPSIDMYMAAWNTGSNPDPTGFYGKKEGFNMLRFTSPELDKALANITTLDNEDPKVRKEHYKKVSDILVTDQAAVIPTFASTSKMYINNRVKKYDSSLAQKDKVPFRNSDIELTAEAPIK